MKRLLALLLCLALPVCALAVEIPALTKDDLVFTLEEQPITLGDPIAPALGLLGKMEITSAPSCMFFGYDREYSNDRFIVATVPSQPDGSDSIESVTVLVSGIPTARGVAVGMTKQQVIEAYGEGFVLDYDQMDYRLDAENPLSARLSFYLDLETDTVVSYMLLLNTTKE